MKHVFLVLNYKNYSDTINFVNSLNKIDEMYEVVIVDNGSENESLKVLNKKFSKQTNIHIIGIDENLGFAKGNNFGYSYIKENIRDVDFIHCTNSDIIIDDPKIIEKTNNIYTNTKFSIMGPKVNTHGKSSSPIALYENKDSFIKHVKRQKVMVYIYSVIAFFFYKIMGNHLEEIWQNRNAKIIRKKLKDDNSFTPVLSGCYIVFSKDFINQFDVLFEPITFLYSEEHILTYKLLNLGIEDIIYQEEFEVKHMHGGSSSGNNKFKVQCELDNLKVMSELYYKNKGD